MAKRRTLNRLSKRYSKHKSIDSIGSGYLDPDTSDIHEEQTFWWNNLQDDTSPPYSLIHNDRNETERQLSLNSKLDSSPNTVEWWKNLKSSNSENNASTSLRQNFSAAIVETNVLESSTSESEKGFNLKKKKIPLRAATRKSNSNNFLNVLNTESIPLKWRMKQARYSTLYSKDSDKDVSQRELRKNEDSINLSSTANILKSKPSIFKKKKSGRMEDRNAFEDVLTQDDVSDDTRIKSKISEKESSTHSVQQDIENSSRKTRKMSQALSLENNEPGPSNLSISNVNTMLENTASDVDTTQSSDESHVKMHNHKVLKLKSSFMQHARKSMGRNAFKDVLADNRDKSLLRHNQNQEIYLHDAKFPMELSPSSSTRFVNKSKDKIDIEGVIASLSVHSPRSPVNVTKRQLLNSPMQQAQDNIESSSIQFTSIQSSSNSSLDKSLRKTLVSFKPKSRFLQRLRDKKKSLIKNPFEEIFEEYGNTSTRKSNSAVPIEDNHTSVERDKTTIGIMQAHGSLATKEDSPLNVNRATSEENVDDILLEVTPSSNERRISDQLIQSENEHELSKNNDVANVSKSASDSVITKTLEKQISSSRKFTRDTSIISKEHTRTNAILYADKTYTNEIGAYQVTNDLHNNVNVENSNVSNRLSESSSSKEIRLARDSSRNRPKTPANKGASGIINNDDLRDDTNRKDSSISNWLFKSSSGKETHLTRYSLRNQSETSRLANKGASEIINNDDLRDDANREQSSSTLIKQSSKLNPGKETRLTHNSSRNHFETPKLAGKGIQEVMDNDNLHNDVNREQNVSTLVRQLFKSSPAKETHLTRNNLRNRLEISKSAKRGEGGRESKEASEIINDDSRDDVNREQDSSTLIKQLSKSSSGKEVRLTRNSPRKRSETPANKKTREVTSDDSSDDANEKREPSMLSKLSPGKKTRLTRNSLGKRSETPANKRAREVTSDDDSSDDANEKREPSMLSELSPGKKTRLTRNSLGKRSETPANKRAREVTSDNDSSDDANKKRDPSMLSELSPGKKTRLTRNSLRNRSETPKLSNKDMELSKRSVNRNVNTEESDDISVGSEIGETSQVISPIRILNTKVSENVTNSESAISPVEIEVVDDEDVVLATQTIQRNSLLSKDKTNNETINRRPSLMVTTITKRTSIKENRGTPQQKSLSGFQNRYNTSKDISKIRSSKISKTIDDFFQIKRPTAVDKQSISNDRNLAPSQVFNAEKMEKIKTELEKIKNREMAAMRMDVATGKKEFALKSVDTALKQVTKKKKLPADPTKIVDKAFLVNGKVYKAPRLPRPKHWVTDHLYKFLWKRMEPKYKLATRVQSEKFVQELAKMVSLIQRRKKYENYKDELKALMKEMARLQIINTRNDFYNFCQDFLPYEFRVKVIPMLLPGNKRTIPYDPEKLHIPLLDSE